MDLLLLGDEIFFDKKRSEDGVSASRSKAGASTDKCKRKVSKDVACVNPKKYPRLDAETRIRSKNRAVVSAAKHGRPSAMEMLRGTTRHESINRRARKSALSDKPHVDTRPSALDLLRDRKQPAADKIVCQIYSTDLMTCYACCSLCICIVKYDLSPL